MPSTKPVHVKSCVRGHLYLGHECPCEQFNRYGAREEQSSRPARSRSSWPDAEPRSAEVAQARASLGVEL